ncbi:MAG: TetR/AcrR family transcriptional regulator C-terminal domain-containing protein [Candidatus Binatia bacterium]
MGRVPRINRDAILRAAEHQAADELTVPNLAKRMGVSVAALYQHMRGQDELLAWLGRCALTKLEVPSWGDLNWAEWLLAYARELRTVLLRFPGALSYVSARAQHSFEWLDQAETVLAALIRAGFSDVEAEKTFLLIVDLVPGIVQREVGCASAVRTLPHLRELTVRGPTELPVVLRLSRVAQAPGDEAFDEAVRTALAGVALRRSELSVAQAILSPRIAPHSPLKRRSATTPRRGRAKA